MFFRLKRSIRETPSDNLTNSTHDMPAELTWCAVKVMQKKERKSFQLSFFSLTLHLILPNATANNKIRYSMNALTWRERIGYCSGELAENLIYQTVSIWLLFYYTNVYGLSPSVTAVMFLVVRIIDVLWDPFVGTFVDKAYPRWGKYRSWLIIGGIPLAGAAVLCFWNGFNSSLLYAYASYILLSMCFTLTCVPYGALGDSLTRDVNQLTILTSVRMLFANFAGLLIKTLPIIIAVFAPKVLNPETGEMQAVYDTPEASSAWLITMSIFAIAGLGLLFFCFSQTREKIVMSAKQSASISMKDMWHELTGNRPMRILSAFFVITFATMSISNATDSYFLTYVAKATPFRTSLFMWLGTIPAFIFIPLVPMIKRRTGKAKLFYLSIGIAIVGMVMMFALSAIPAMRSQFTLLCVSQFIKSSGIIVATGYMWALVPEVVTFGEYLTGRRVAAIVTALICIFMKAGIAIGGVIPGLVLDFVGFLPGNSAQTSFAVQGIIWLVTVIPALLLFGSAFVIRRYELTDTRMNEINKIVEERKMKAED